MIIDKLIDSILEKNNPTCVGIDTDFSYLPEDFANNCKTLEDVSRAILQFNMDIIDSIADIVPAVKVQVAYYEKYGVMGMIAFAKTCEYAKKKGLFVIADVKRNDIGSTAACYSTAYLGEVDINGKKYSPFVCDFATVNGYLGSDGLLPFVDDCKKYDKGIFVLVKTSNKSSGELQDKVFENNNTLYVEMGNLVQKLGSEQIGKYGYSNIGGVVGATHSIQAKEIRSRFPNMFFLIPGYGAQGGTAEDLSVCFKNGMGGIVNSSRGIICAYKTSKYEGQSYMAAARNAAIDMQIDLSSAIKDGGL